MEENEIDKWLKQIDRDFRAITKIIVEKEQMLRDLEKKREALIELKHMRNLKNQGD